MKRLLFLGIILLVVGILLRKLTQLDIFGLILIISGVSFKVIYFISKIKSGEYKPGKELIFLGVGLLIFLTGVYFKKVSQSSINPNFLIFFGLTLKIVFILLFIKKVRSFKK